MAMKMRLKMKSKPQRYDLNRSRPRHGRKHSKYKMHHSIINVVCIKACVRYFLSNFHFFTK